MTTDGIPVSSGDGRWDASVWDDWSLVHVVDDDALQDYWNTVHANRDGLAWECEPAGFDTQGRESYIVKLASDVTVKVDSVTCPIRQRLRRFTGATANSNNSAGAPGILSSLASTG
jgi:hypothetical protein